MKLKFFRSDFPCDQDWGSEEFAEHAQKIFDAWYDQHIESAPVVYGYKNTSGSWVWSDKTNRTPDTHKACLCFVEELKKEPCKVHKPTPYEPGKYMVCETCGISFKRVITWEPA